MKGFRIALGVTATLLLLLAVACGDDDGDGSGGSDGATSDQSGGGFPPVSGGNVLPEAAVVDLNKGADPPFIYTQDFELQDCTFNPRGKNAFYDSLEAGAYTKSELPGKIGEIAQKEVSYRKDYLVMAETKKLNLEGIGQVEAAIVQEREFENDKQIQVSFNWYSVCEQTGSVFAFGEDSFALNPETGEVTDTEGSWLAGYINTLGEVSVPSMQVPGTVTVGAKYIFDGAPGIALGGSEIIAHVNIKDGKLTTAPTKYYAGESDIPMPFAESAGDMTCVQIEEISQDSGTRRPDLTDVTNKVWCPNGFGLAYDTSDGWLLSATVLSQEEASKLYQTIEDNQVRELAQ